MKRSLWPAVLAATLCHAQPLPAEAQPEPRQGDVESLERIADDFGRQLAADLGVDARLHVTARGRTEAQPGGEVLLSAAQVRDIATSAEIPFEDVGRFAIAHELVHELQFQHYGSTDVLATNPDSRRVYECQADLLAASVTSLGPRNSRRYMRAAFALGGSGMHDAQHPTNMQRLAAVSHGALLAQSRRRRPHVRRELRTSLATCKSIVHAPRDVASSLVLVDKQVDWSRSGSWPYVEYSLTYQNTGTFTVDAEVTVETTRRRRSEPDDPLSERVYKERTFKLRLAPGERRAVSGRLRWYGDQEEFPSIRFAPRQGSRYTVSRAHATASVSAPSEGSLSLKSPGGFELADLVEEVADASDDDWRGLRAGAGEEEEDPVTGRVHWVKHAAALSTTRPSRIYVTHELNTDAWDLEIEFMRSARCSSARRARQAVVRELEQEHPDVTRHQPLESSDGAYSAIKLTDDGVNLSAVVIEKRNGTCDFNVVIYRG